jgi:hypothetical protein
MRAIHRAIHFDVTSFRVLRIELILYVPAIELFIQALQPSSDFGSLSVYAACNKSVIYLFQDTY